MTRSVERPYRWLQDRIVRTCALEQLSSLEEARREGNSLFRPFALPKPYTSSKDVFCLRGTRLVDGYRKISLFGQFIEVPYAPLREYVEVHLLPDLSREALEVRIGWQQKMVRSVHIPYPKNWVHF
jgi:hypothetical protein